MLGIGDNVVYEGREYTVLWIYANGNCELVESSLARPNRTILVHVDNLEKGTRNV